MDIQQMVNFHISNLAKVTIAAIPVPIKEARHFGIIQVDANGRVVGFQEKPDNPQCIPGRPNEAFASMGNYIFKGPFLTEVLHADAKNPDSSHDFGKDILPSIYKEHPVFAYDFARNRVPDITEEEIGYWRDVGNIGSFWEANMDLRNVKPVFNLYNLKWPIKTSSMILPPAKFVFNQDGRRGQAVNSLVADGSIISGGVVQDSVVGRSVTVDTGAAIINSILMDRVHVGANCKINMAIIDKDVTIPPGTEIGYDPEADKKRFHVDEDSNIVVIHKSYKFPETSSQ
jgi:glucose-1-phosphate adenylyltransferase